MTLAYEIARRGKQMRDEMMSLAENFPTRPHSRPSWTPRNGQLVPVMVWQFKNGSTAPVWAGDELPPRFLVATDRSLGCLVAYER